MPGCGRGISLATVAQHGFVDENRNFDWRCVVLHLGFCKTTLMSSPGTSSWREWLTYEGYRRRFTIESSSALSALSTMYSTECSRLVSMPRWRSPLGCGIWAKMP